MMGVDLSSEFGYGAFQRATSARIGLLLSLIVLALGSASGCGRANAEHELPLGSAAPPPPSIPKLADVKANAPVVVGALGKAGVGTLHPSKEAQLAAKATGVIQEMRVEQGDRVKQGQLLFRLDARQAGLGVEQAKAAVAAAEVAQKAAQLDYGRAKELFDRGSLPPAQHDQAKARLDGANVAVSQANVALSMAQTAAADTSVVAPFAGVITARFKTAGEMVTMMPPTVVVVLQDLEQLELRARLPDRALASLAVGDPLHLFFPSLALKRDVPVARLNPSVDSRTRTVEVIAMIDNKSGELRPGMLAEVDFDGADAGVPSDPVSADGAGKP